MNIGVAKVFQIGAKVRKKIKGGSCTAKVQYYFHKLKGRLVWREPHSAIPWLRHCISYEIVNFNGRKSEPCCISSNNFVCMHRLQERAEAADERSQDLEATLREERQRIQTLERRYS